MARPASEIGKEATPQNQILAVIRHSAISARGFYFLNGKEFLERLTPTRLLSHTQFDCARAISSFPG